MRRFVAIAISMIVALSAAAPIVSVVAQEPPTDVEGTFEVPDELNPCPFRVLIELSGKGKTIELGERTILTSPGLTATLTNLDDPANQETLTNQETLSITGAFHQTVLENGDVKTVVTGRNILFDPEAGFVLAIGRFSYVFDQAGNLVQPLAGEGQLIDLCDLLSPPE